MEYRSYAFKRLDAHVWIAAEIGYLRRRVIGGRFSKRRGSSGCDENRKLCCLCLGTTMRINVLQRVPQCCSKTRAIGGHGGDG